jgi:hypothetical protein
MNNVNLIIIPIVSILFMGIGISIFISSRGSKANNLISDALMNGSVIYSLVDDVYCNDQRITKFVGERFIKEIANRLSFFTAKGNCTIKTRAKWDKVDNYLYQVVEYTNEDIELNANLVVGTEYVLLFADIKGQEISSTSFYQEAFSDDKRTIALLLVPLDEYVKKYFDAKMF